MGFHKGAALWPPEAVFTPHTPPTLQLSPTTPNNLTLSCPLLRPLLLFPLPSGYAARPPACSGSRLMMPVSSS